MPEPRRKRRVGTDGDEFLALEDAALPRGSAQVFRNTNWTWHRGQQWAMLGTDGAGKSLLIEALLGHVPLARGDLRGPHGLADSEEADPAQTIAHVSPLTQRRLAVQESSFYQSRWHSGVEEGRLTVGQFLSQASVEEHNPFEVGARSASPRVFLRRRKRLVEWLGLAPLLPSKLVHLSSGEMRKTLLVHALLKAPRLLILEDPFAGLDVATRRLLRRIVPQIMDEGTPVLVATSRAEEIPTSTTHLLIVRQHRIVFQGPKRPGLRLWRELSHAKSPRPATDAARSDGAARRRGTARAGAPLVELRDVSVTMGRRRLLQEVTWTLRAGERWALFGHNGAGKTTLLSLIQGDHPQAYAQDVRLFGRTNDSTRTLWQMRRRMGWMSPELHQHYPGQWPVIDVVCSGFFNTIGLYEPCSPHRRASARRWLGEVGLGPYGDDPLEALTFGQQRLVLLARAAVKKPSLLILDEPCQGLDAPQRRTVLAAVDRALATTAAGLIFVTHHAGEVPACITHVLHLAAGRIRSAGPLR